MEFVLDPPHGIGPLRLGMTIDEARATLTTFGPLSSNRVVAVSLPSGLRFSLGFGVGPTRNRVNSIEVWRPYRPGDVVRFRDME
jgi:hypothetical protein